MKTNNAELEKPVSKYDHICECPYCGNHVSEDYNVCCGEAGHAEWVYVNEHGEHVDPDTGEVIS